MPRLERGRWKAKQIWEISVEGCRWTIRYGRVDEEPQTYSRECASNVKALAEADVLIAQRVADGYAVVDEAPAPPAPPPPSELERQLRERPDDDALRLVYADSLEAHDDPRGRLMALDRQLRDTPHDSELVVAKHALLSLHREHLLGPLAATDPACVHLGWRDGFLHDVLLAGDGRMHAVDMLASLCRLPDAHFVEVLRLGLPGDLHYAYGEILEWLAGHAEQLPRLRHLVIGAFERGAHAELSWVQIGELGALYAAFPRLEHLVVQGDFTLGDIDLPELRQFAGYTCGLSAGNIASLCEARWPKLEKLIAWFGGADYGGDLESPDELAPIFAGDGLPALRHLGLCNAPITDALCRALRDAPIARRLETLDLTLGTLGDDGAETLATTAFPRLRQLDVSGNYLTDAGLARLATLGVTVVSTDQRTGDDRYPSVTE